MRRTVLVVFLCPQVPDRDRHCIQPQASVLPWALSPPYCPLTLESVCATYMQGRAASGHLPEKLATSLEGLWLPHGCLLFLNFCPWSSLSGK